MRPDPVISYLMRQCQYILEEITPQEIEVMQEMPMQVHREIAGLKIGIPTTYLIRIRVAN